MDAYSLTPQSDLGSSIRQFEILVHKGFSDLEVASVTHTLACANNVLGLEYFTWRFTADMPGFVTSDSGMIVRAEPAIVDHGFSDIIVIVGGKGALGPTWLRRARAMQRQARSVVLLSDAATAYIKAVDAPPGFVTTHWRDIAGLSEEGYYPNLTSRFSENSDGIITAAGSGATIELILGLIAPTLDAVVVAEIASRLLLHTVRKSTAEQPKDIADNPALFDSRVTQVIKLMEEHIEDPMVITDLTRQVGLSSRHLERVFREVFDETPARFYKRLRVKRARNMIEETLVPLIDVAVATGFKSHYALSKAVRDEYGITPSKMRARKKIKLLQFDGSQNAK